VVGALDLPSEPEDRGRAESAGYSGAVRGKTRDTPDPDERGRAYEAIQAHVSAETGDAAESSRHPDRTDTRNYWDEVPTFLGRWADHEKKWPADQQPAVDRSADPPGSYRSNGGFYLSPGRHAEAVAAIGRVRDAAPAISADVQRVEQDNRHGAWLEGFKNRLKGDDRLKEKVAERLEGELDKEPVEILRNVPDAIRYTFCLQPETYSRGYYDIKERLESSGYLIYESRNAWDGAEYKGINTRWVTPEGQRFEVQFHTPESFHAKQLVTHDAYERLRNPRTTDNERAELKAFQREVCWYIQVPDGARDIPDFKRKASR
jgi:hypothetical protein